MHFFHEILGMHALRHEEFREVRCLLLPLPAAMAFAQLGLAQRLEGSMMDVVTSRCPAGRCCRAVRPPATALTTGCGARQ